MNETLYAAMEKHGADRVRMLLATTISNAEWDGRYDQSVKQWARHVPPFPQPPGYEGTPRHLYFFINAYPCHINYAACSFMKYEQWRADFAGLAACKKAFLWRDDFEKSYYDYLDNNIPRKLDRIIKRHGIYTVRRVFAATITGINGEMARSIHPDVHEWAKQTEPFPPSPNPNASHDSLEEIRLTSFHPNLINAAAQEAMRVEAKQMASGRSYRKGDAR